MTRRREWSKYLAMAVLFATAIVALVLGPTSEASLPKGVLVPGGELSAWSSDGGELASPEKGAIRVRGPDGETRTLKGKGIGYFGWPCECRLGWSADGSQILFLSRRSDVEGNATVGVIDSDGQGLETASLGVPVGAADWSPQGWPLVFVPNSRSIRVGGRRIGPNPDLWLLEGLRAKPRLLLRQKGEENDPRFSPDGREILYQRSDGHGSDLWEVGVDGSDPHPVANLYGEAVPAWSPDGTQIAFTAFSATDHRCHLFLMDSTGGHRHQVTDEEVLPDRPAWKPDGTSIAFAIYGGEIRQVDLTTGKIETLADFPGKEVRDLEWSPDGRHLAYSARIARHPD